MKNPLTAHEVNTIAHTLTTGIQQMNQSLLLAECRRYNQLPELTRSGPTGRAIYKRMKSLNEKVLAA